MSPKITNYFFTLLSILLLKSLSLPIFDIKQPSLPETLYINYNENKGYSSYSYSLSKKNCYFPTNIITNSSSKNIRSIDNEVEYETLLEYLNIKNSKNDPQFNLYSNELMKLVNDIKPDELSFTITYFISNEVTVENQYNTDTIESLLTEEGKNIYQNDINNFLFLCGDELINKYQKGNLLILSLKLNFYHKSDKAEFLKNQHDSFGPYSGVYKYIKDRITHIRFNGLLQIKALQIGGDIEKFKLIMSSPEEKECPFAKIDNCKGLYDRLFKYANNEFNQQTDDEMRIQNDFLSISRTIKIDNNKYNIPEFKLSDTIKNSQDYLLSFSKKLLYYYNHLQVAPYYQVYSEILNNYYKQVKELINKFYDDNIIEAFENPTDKLCSSLKEKYSSQEIVNLEDEIVKTMNTMKYYSLYRVKLEGNMCLKGNMKWDSNYTIDMYLFPNGKGKDLALYVNDFKHSNKKVEENEDFSFELVDGPFNFNMQIKNKKEKKRARFICIEKSLNIEQSFIIGKVEDNNPYYFGRYVEE